MNVRTNKRVKYAAYAAALALLFSYAYYEVRALLEGPTITIYRPQNGATIRGTATTTIEGATERITHISMDGRKIFVNEKGVFSESLLLLPGYNIISIEAQDFFGRTTRKSLELMHE